MRLATHWDASVVRMALLVAALVGPTLVLVNQGSALLHGLPIDLGKALLTMLVPFFVASVSGTMARSRAAIESAKREQRLAEDLRAVSSMVLEILRATEIGLTATRSIGMLPSEPVAQGDKLLVATDAHAAKLRAATGEIAISSEQSMHLARAVLARLDGLVDVRALK